MGAASKCSLPRQEHRGEGSAVQNLLPRQVKVLGLQSPEAPGAGELQSQKWWETMSSHQQRGPRRNQAADSSGLLNTHETMKNRQEGATHRPAEMCFPHGRGISIRKGAVVMSELTDSMGEVGHGVES